MVADAEEVAEPCSFAVAKHRHPSPKFEVRAAMGPCQDGKICVQGIQVLVGETTIELSADNGTVRKSLP